MNIEDRKYIWYMYQLQRAVDTIAKMEAEIKGDMLMHNSDSWDARAIE